MDAKLFALLCVGIGLLDAVKGQCVERRYGHDSFVCVCNGDFCDEPGVLASPATGTYIVYTSGRDALRLQPSSGDIEDSSANGGYQVSVNTTAQYQTIIGFGGSFTDSAGLNLNTLSDKARDMALRSYFAPEGSEYSVVRVPIGGSDFSTRKYSLDDVEGDVTLEYFSLALEDYYYKIPNLVRSMELSNQEVYVFGSPWSPPAWMKTNGEFTGAGSLLPEYWQIYAEYLAKWAAAYEEAGVPIWGLTPQNEPLDEETDWGINACKWPPEDMRDWIRDNLGPTLQAAGYGHLVMMVNDFNRDKLPYYVEPLFSDPECSQYISGVAVHWYNDQVVSPDVLVETHELDPSKFILYTEACNGIFEDNPDSVYLGDWTRAERYVYDILENVNHYASGWVDWNVALDTLGGPQWPGGAMDSPIILNATADEFYKQPMHYGLAHFSKFFRRGSLRLDVSVTGDATPEAQAAAVLRTDGSIAVVLLSTSEEPETVTVAFDGTKFVNVEVPPRSFSTFVVAL